MRTKSCIEFDSLPTGALTCCCPLCSWSVSFYPQVLLNYRRKTSVGLSFDFLLYNVLAFSCYSAFTCSLYWSKSVQRAYDKRHAGQPNKVQLNDAVFALHATFVSFFTLAQVVYYDWRDRKQRPSSAAVAVCGVILASSSAYALSVWAGRTTRGNGSDRGLLNWLDFLYFLSYVKVVTGIIKYVPQVILNIRRHSTAGWTIWNVILDLTGGLLSVVQLVLDCWNTGDWGGIAGYPVKFAIGFVSVFFDLIFLFQHYVLYPQPRAVIKVDGFLPSGTASAPLLREGAPGGGGEGWWIDEEDDGSSTREE
ncbi:conserved unknown protein [Ectocarpus siliculosus]|uniref:Cystinosin n=1 Tax=Ectocarpus siliculosus TaxID=2880 RepID=D7FJH4_ECTSI|nr:conserved unknown protein [Ectocarpus siliculosus]|eukprot:CBJ29077.1 conserved unknown protein [Ectocarpus siliculosus]